MNSAAPATSLKVRLRSYVVIPARLESTRLPRKLLLRQTGRPLIQHTYESAQRASKPLGVLVAADHAEMAEAVTSFGGQVQMTSPELPSGTDRVAQAARSLPDADVLVNVQGDEPEISGEAIDLVISLLENAPAVSMATLATPIRCRGKLDDPNCVKVVLDSDGRARYFSRSPIPYARDWSDDLLDSTPPVFLQHIGLYAYRREFLLGLNQIPPCPLEAIEKLEQLRILYAGESIAVGVIDEPSIGIDTADDYAEFVARVNKNRL